jgi:hypothetical protein
MSDFNEISKHYTCKHCSKSFTTNKYKCKHEKSCKKQNNSVNNLDNLDNINSSDNNLDNSVNNLDNSVNNLDNSVNIRDPDNEYVDTLLGPINNNYNEEESLKKALADSLKNAENEYIQFQLDQIKAREYELLIEEALKVSLLENKKTERVQSLENILFQLVKLKRIDTKFNENLIILEDIIKKYINCEIDNYKISSEIYTNIFYQLRNIRIKDTELDLIKNILVV